MDYPFVNVIVPSCVFISIEKKKHPNEKSLTKCLGTLFIISLPDRPDFSVNFARNPARISEKLKKTRILPGLFRNYPDFTHIFDAKFQKHGKKTWQAYFISIDFHTFQVRFIYM